MTSADVVIICPGKYVLLSIFYPWIWRAGVPKMAIVWKEIHLPIHHFGGCIHILWKEYSNLRPTYNPVHLSQQKNPAGHFPWNTGCLMTGSLFHGLLYRIPTNNWVAFHPRHIPNKPFPPSSSINQPSCRSRVSQTRAASICFSLRSQ